MSAVKNLSLIGLLTAFLVNVASAQTSGAARDSLKRKRVATELQAAQAKVAAEEAARQAEQLAAEKAADLALAKAQAELVAKTEADRIAAQQAEAEQKAAQALAAKQALAAQQTQTRSKEAARIAAVERAQKANLTLTADADARAIAPEPAVVAANRFASTAAGVVRDAVAKLEWLQSDNGKDISWQDAKGYCESRGWRLPTQTQLLSIFDRSGTLSAPCGSARCKVSPLFQLTSRYGFYWSSEANGDAEAWHVALDFGTRTSSPMSESMDTRALCVRKGA